GFTVAAADEKQGNALGWLRHRYPSSQGSVTEGRERACRAHRPGQALVRPRSGPPPPARCRRTAPRRPPVPARRLPAHAPGVRHSSRSTAVSGSGLAVEAEPAVGLRGAPEVRSEEHTSELQSRENLVCRLLLEKK